MISAGNFTNRARLRPATQRVGRYNPSLAPTILQACSNRSPTLPWMSVKKISSPPRQSRRHAAAV